MEGGREGWSLKKQGSMGNDGKRRQGRKEETGSAGTIVSDEGSN